MRSPIKPDRRSTPKTPSNTAADLRLTDNRPDSRLELITAAATTPDGRRSCVRIARAPPKFFPRSDRERDRVCLAWHHVRETIRPKIAEYPFHPHPSHPRARAHMCTFWSAVLVRCRNEDAEARALPRVISSSSRQRLCFAPPIELCTSDPAIKYASVNYKLAFHSREDFLSRRHTSVVIATTPYEVTSTPNLAMKLQRMILRLSLFDFSRKAVSMGK